jgi:hypothetical protein
MSCSGRNLPDADGPNGRRAEVSGYIRLSRGESPLARDGAEGVSEFIAIKFECDIMGCLTTLVVGTHQ